MRTGSVVVWILVSVTVPLGAQVTRPQFGIATGVAVPTGQFHSAFRGEGFNQGLDEMASLSFRIRGLPADLRLDATYQSHGANDALKSDLRVAFAADGDEHVKLLGLSLDLSRSLLSGHPFRPYLLAGAGVSRSSVSITAGAVKGGSSGTAFAWNLGGGILYQLRKVALLMEGRFVSIGSAAGLPRITVVPIVIGLRFGNR